MAAAAIPIIGAVAGSVVSGMMNGGGGGGQASPQQQQVYDPYAPYRAQAAQQLNALMSDPSKVQSLPEWGAMQQAAARTMAAQGYTGSGNALVASANAGGQAYQQAFNNLALLAGAGQSPAYGAGMANQAAMGQQNMQNGMFGALGNDFGHWFGGLGSGPGNVTQGGTYGVGPPTGNYGFSYSGFGSYG